MDINNYKENLFGKIEQKTIRKYKDERKEAIADEVFEYFKGAKKPIQRSLIKKWCGEIGNQAITDIFEAVKKIEGYNRIGLFINMVKTEKAKIKWQ